MQHNAKQCIKCKDIKELRLFVSDGNRCKVCVASYKKQWKLQNLNRVAEQNQKWREDNKEQHAESMKVCYERRKREDKNWAAKRTKYDLQWKSVNKDKVNAASKRYREKHKTKINEAFKSRRKEDINFRLAGYLRSRLSHALREGRKVGSAIKDLGCLIEKLRKHLESQFQQGMSWDNYGKWHIDHILPLAKFDFTDHKQLAKVYHYSNLQPLWAEDNLKKSDKVEPIVCTMQL